LLGGILVLCSVFAIRPDAQAEIVGAGNTGLTFEWMPELFGRIPAGGAFMALFFLALTVAALTSLMAMVELATRSLTDLGVERGKALIGVGVVGLVAGLPSALSQAVFDNQDWVWGVGLIVSGLFFALAARRFGLERLRTEVVNADGADLPQGRRWSLLVGIAVPVQAVILVLWWLWQARGWDPEGWLDPLASASVGTVLAQWALVLVGLVLLNRWLVRRLARGTGE
jgi:NSS family neurotransmitter:Na+ symporter